MNQQLQDFARANLKDNLSKCSDSERVIFKRMYSHENIGKHINIVVDDLNTERLDWAMQQVQCTLDKK